MEERELDDNFDNRLFKTCRQCEISGNGISDILQNCVQFFAYECNTVFEKLCSFCNHPKLFHVFTQSSSSSSSTTSMFCSKDSSSEAVGFSSGVVRSTNSAFKSEVSAYCHYSTVPFRVVVGN